MMRQATKAIILLSAALLNSEVVGTSLRGNNNLSGNSKHADNEDLQIQKGKVGDEASPGFFNEVVMDTVNRRLQQNGNLRECPAPESSHYQRLDSTVSCTTNDMCPFGTCCLFPFCICLPSQGAGPGQGCTTTVPDRTDDQTGEDGLDIIVDTSAPVEPTPTAPAPITPVTSAPITPAPVTPAPVTPAPQPSPGLRECPSPTSSSFQSLPSQQSCSTNEECPEGSCCLFPFCTCQNPLGAPSNQGCTTTVPDRTDDQTGGDGPDIIVDTSAPVEPTPATSAPITPAPVTSAPIIPTLAPMPTGGLMDCPSSESHHFQSLPSEQKCSTNGECPEGTCCLFPYCTCHRPDGAQAGQGCNTSPDV
eukprot:CAMPEP_0202474032 /NCGR_PEP_ID=MMETSP1360-20130828/92165_1 /ASSEMBLY_ACC=CAM_ASM_000848 /TAXON_ID=515479 /ORGANISM="Licmophora paradoxa, Strain CCMP2313" /LENGTH=361 /DNA_ID=CAMNT_0049101127 /DNA_START=46 /DNA_END=1131 /DNA_ORIENTATION=-